MNNGKVMEQQFRKSAKKVPGLFFYRLRDGTASFYGGKEDSRIRFQQRNIADVVMFKTPVLYLLELKTHNGASLPRAKVRENNLKDLAEAAEYSNVVSGFIVDFAERGKAFYVDSRRVKQFLEDADRKSIPIAWFEQNGVRVGIQQLKVNKLYDVKTFTDEMNKKAI